MAVERYKRLERPKGGWGVVEQPSQDNVVEFIAREQIQAPNEGVSLSARGFSLRLGIVCKWTAGMFIIPLRLLVGALFLGAIAFCECPIEMVKELRDS